MTKTTSMSKDPTTTPRAMPTRTARATPAQVCHTTLLFIRFYYSRIVVTSTRVVAYYSSTRGSPTNEYLQIERFVSRRQKPGTFFRRK